MKKVYITRRTAEGLLTRCAELREIAARFRAVGSRGRAQQLEDTAATLEKMGKDLREELRHKDARMLRQIGPPRMGENGFQA